MIRGLKLFSGALLLAIVSLFIKQNLPTFSTELPFYLDLHIREKLYWYHTAGSLVLISLIAGFLVGFLLGFKMYWRKRKELNMLKQAVEPSSQDELQKEENIQK